MAAAFDRIGHSRLLAQLGSFPGQGDDPGLAEGGRSRAGQGVRADRGGNSPGRRDFPRAFLNVALHGLEEAAGVRYLARLPGRGPQRGSPVAIRYADDVVVLCPSQEQAGQVKARLAEWLAPRGLAFNEDKTKIVHLSEGFDFLGFNVRRYPNRKLLIKPSKAAVRRLRERLAAEMRTLRGGNAMAVIAALNPIIRLGGLLPGVVSCKTFGSLDDYLWKLSYKWATWRHNNKPERWIAGRYFGKFNPFRNDHWVLGDRASGACLVKFSRTAIRRHVPAKGAVSPDDPALAGYRAERRKKVKPPLDSYTRFIAQACQTDSCGITTSQPVAARCSRNDRGRHYLAGVGRLAVVTQERPGHVRGVRGGGRADRSKPDRLDEQR